MVQELEAWIEKYVGHVSGYRFEIDVPREDKTIGKLVLNGSY
jgi:hypothetical protein